MQPGERGIDPSILAEAESNPPRRRPPYRIYAYTAREWDPEINLYYYRARYYDPKVGRFFSEDPVDYRDGLSRHLYALGNPVNLFDPSGRTAKRRMNVCKDCPTDVKDGARDACIGGASHPDASVRRCVKRRCNELTKVVCTFDDYDCYRGSSPAYTSESQDQIKVCINNRPPPNTCWKRIMLHELWIHVCNPIDPHVPDAQHFGPGSLGEYIQKTTRCP